MTSVRILWLLLCLLWVGAEVLLARKNQLKNNGMIIDKEHRSQWILWITLICSLVAALFFKTQGLAPIGIAYLPRQFMALLLFAAGLYLRFIAIRKLGHFFTTNVSIQSEHRLIIDGPYSWVRHPAYTGLIIAFAGAGFAMGDLIAIVSLTVPAFFAFNYRIDIEEKMLSKRFGMQYSNYCKKTKKLLPWLV